MFCRFDADGQEDCAPTRDERGCSRRSRAREVWSCILLSSRRALLKGINEGGRRLVDGSFSVRATRATVNDWRATDGLHKERMSDCFAFLLPCFLAPFPENDGSPPRSSRENQYISHATGIAVRRLFFLVFGPPTDRHALCSYRRAAAVEDADSTRFTVIRDIRLIPSLGRASSYSACCTSLQSTTHLCGGTLPDDDGMGFLFSFFLSPPSFRFPSSLWLIVLSLLVCSPALSFLPMARRTFWNWVGPSSAGGPTSYLLAMVVVEVVVVTVAIEQGGNTRSGGEEKKKKNGTGRYGRRSWRGTHAHCTSI